MTDRNVPITSDPVPEELLSTVTSNGYVPLRENLTDQWQRFKDSEKFKKYIASEMLNPAILFEEVAKKLPNPEKEYNALLSLYSRMKKDKQMKEFIKYFAEDLKYMIPLFEVGIRGSSSLCTVFVEFCGKEFSPDDMKNYFKMKAILDKDNYSDFMKSFDKLIKSTNQFKEWNMSGTRKNALIELHKDYWDSTNGKPKVLVKSKKETVEVKGSNSEPPKEKETTKKKRTKPLLPGGPAPDVGK